MTKQTEMPDSTRACLSGEELAEERAREILAGAYSKIFVSDGSKEDRIRAGKNPSIPANAAITAIMQATSEVSGGNGAEAMRVIDAARAWHKSRTEYLIMCEIALSVSAPPDGDKRYRKEAAASAFAASELVAALQALDCHLSLPARPRMHERLALIAGEACRAEMSITTAAVCQAAYWAQKEERPDASPSLHHQAGK